jgi:hypothetical protein
MLITDAAVQETAAGLAQALGGGWTLDPAAPADGAAHLLDSEGRGISFRPIFGGTTVQLWITGNPASTLPNGASPTEQAEHEARLAARLPEGHHYNKAATLVTEDDEEPLDIILRTLEEHLLPAFEFKPRYVGHRPWIDIFDKALAEVASDPDDSPTTVSDDADSHPMDEAPAKAAAKQEDPQEPTSPQGERWPGDAIADQAADDPTESTPAPETAPKQPADSDAGDDPEEAARQSVGEFGGDSSTRTIANDPAPKRRPRKAAPKRRPKTSAD